MGWERVQRRVVGKVDDVLCEDVTVETAVRFAVIDGAADSSGLSYVWEGRQVSSGRFAAEVIAAELRLAPAGVGPLVLAAAVSEVLRVAVDEQHPGVPLSMRPSASVVAFEVGTEVMWAVGDACAGWEDQSGVVKVWAPSKLVDEVNGLVRAAIHAALAADGAAWGGRTGSGSCCGAAVDQAAGGVGEYVRRVRLSGGERVAGPG
jgi:hypothetical protein